MIENSLIKDFHEHFPTTGNLIFSKYAYRNYTRPSIVYLQTDVI